MKHIIAMAADPYGFSLKNAIKQSFENQGYKVIDFTPDHPVEYSEAACMVSQAIQSKKADRGIAICGTGMGVSIVCNKHKGIYASLCENVWQAVRSVTVNNTNVLCLGGMITGEHLGVQIANEWLNAEHMVGLDPEMAEIVKDEADRLRSLEDDLY